MTARSTAEVASKSHSGIVGYGLRFGDTGWAAAKTFRSESADIGRSAEVAEPWGREGLPARRGLPSHPLPRVDPVMSVRGRDSMEETGTRCIACALSASNSGACPLGTWRGALSTVLAVFLPWTCASVVVFAGRHPDSDISFGFTAVFVRVTLSRFWNSGFPCIAVFSTVSQSMYTDWAQSHAEQGPTSSVPGSARSRWCRVRYNPQN